MDDFTTVDGRPQFNHFAVTVPSELMNETNRAEILRFLSEVFGWYERPAWTDPGKLLMVSAGSAQQFLVLFGSDEVRADPMADHLGMKVSELEQVHTYRERALKFAETQPGCEVTDMRCDFIGDAEPTNLHSFYVRYMIPVKFEVQWYEYLEEAAAAAAAAAAADA